MVKKIISIVGARPQFIKLAPLCQELRKQKSRFRHVIVHTGQHYDYNMSKIFFDQLGIPDPQYHLDVGSGSHGQQTGTMLEKIENVLQKEKPDWVMVYGDTNSTLAGALAATKLHMPLAHVEAGLRSYNRVMPEEINRVLTDHCSDVLFCPTRNAVNNLKKEGISNGRARKVVNVGDVMYDSLLLSLQVAKKQSRVLAELQLTPKQYFLATIHRAENTDNDENLTGILQALTELSREAMLVLPIHPRTKKILERSAKLKSLAHSLKIIPAVGYFDMLLLEKNAKLILTDSGGMQKEAYFLSTPCVTLRNETEWIETVQSGLNILGSIQPRRIIQSAKAILKKNIAIRRNRTLLGRGQTGQAIVSFLINH
ncbi:MAG: UDP-N-acetylglucosamine 2-epimerase (non-hydrolyzing) [Candidatus Omnitrophica bacterium]|nr:UDP-N-acetylglucosamine 2-epimerase (non-hydrolyzing) [Candidatus Omnitrophota bacterium]